MPVLGDICFKNANLITSDLINLVIFTFFFHFLWKIFAIFQVFWTLGVWNIFGGHQLGFWKVFYWQPNSFKDFNNQKLKKNFIKIFVFFFNLTFFSKIRFLIKIKLTSFSIFSIFILLMNSFKGLRFTEKTFVRDSLNINFPEFQQLFDFNFSKLLFVQKICELFCLLSSFWYFRSKKI